MKRIYLLLSAALLSLCALNLSAAEKEQKAEPKNNLKFYGFIRNYFAFDSRESVSGTGDLFYYLPKDVKMVDGIDVNDQPSFVFLALTSRLGVDVSGYSIDNVHFGAKLEADFYSGLSNSSNANAGVYFPEQISPSTLEESGAQYHNIISQNNSTPRVSSKEQFNKRLKKNRRDGR